MVLDTMLSPETCNCFCYILVIINATLICFMLAMLIYQFTRLAYWGNARHNLLWKDYKPRMLALAVILTLGEACACFEAIKCVLEG